MAKAKKEPEEVKAGYSGLYNEDDFKNWCVQAEANWNKNKDNFETDRKYFENVQAPSDVPLGADHVNYRFAQTDDIGQYQSQCNWWR